MLVAVECCYAKEWRGLVPLHSTRADVVRLMSHCADEKEACAFKLADANVYILFSGGLTENYADCSTRLPSETVMFIDVGLLTPSSFSSLRLDKKRFRSFNPSHPVQMNLKGYWSEDEGLLVKTFKGKVVELVYLATASNRSACPGFYQDPESFVRVIHVPILNVICSRDTIQAGENITATAYANFNDRLGYAWSISGGKILSGRNTNRITIDTSGVPESVIVCICGKSRSVRPHRVGVV